MTNSSLTPTAEGAASRSVVQILCEMDDVVKNVAELSTAVFMLTCSGSSFDEHEVRAVRRVADQLAAEAGRVEVEFGRALAAARRPA